MSTEPAIRPTRESTIIRARGWILEGRRLDMGAIAADVGVGRATIHRWFGTREGLIGDTIWALMEHTFEEVEPEADGRGADRISFVVCGAAERFASSAPIARFIAAEPKALGVLVSPESRVMERFAARVQRLIDVEIRLGALAAELDAEAAATLIARVSTALCFADLAAEQGPDLKTVELTVRAFLR